MLGLEQQLAERRRLGLEVDPVDLGARRHHRAHGAVAEPHDAGDHAALVRFDGAVMLGLGDQHLDLLVGDALLALLALAEQIEDGAAGNVEQPGQRCGDLGEHGHEGCGAHRDRLGIAQRDLLGNELADDQRDIGDDRHDDADAEGAGHPVGNAIVDEQVAQALAERGAGEGAGEHADQRDADLHGRQEAAGIGAELERAAGAAHVPVDHRFQPGRAGRDDRQFGHGEQAVDDDEDDHRADFEINHGAVY